MKQTDRTNNHGLFKLLLFSLVMLLPIGAWGQAQIQYYPIEVGGVTVTSENSESVTGDNIDGMVKYDDQTSTLTLDNANISSGGIFFQVNGNLNLVISGTCTVRGNISSLGSSTLTLQLDDTDISGTLTYVPSNYEDPTGFTNVVYDGMYLAQDYLNVSQNLVSQRNVKYSPTRQRFEESQWQTVSTIYFSNEKNYELWLGGTKVSEDNRNNIFDSENSEGIATASFNPDNNTLTLTDLTMEGNSIYNSGIISRLDNLIISLNGTNTIYCNDTCTAIRADKEGEQTLTIVKGSDNSSLALSATQAIHDFKTLTLTDLAWNKNYIYRYDETMSTSADRYRLMEDDNVEAGKNYATGTMPALFDSSVEIYNLWVAGTQVTSANAADIQNKYINATNVSFDADHNTLTLQQADINIQDLWGFPAVSSSLPNLTVNLVSDNSVSLNVANPYFVKYNGEAGANPQLTLATEGYMDDGLYWLGSLTLEGVNSTDALTDGYTVSNTIDEMMMDAADVPPVSDYVNTLESGWKWYSDAAAAAAAIKIFKFEVFDLWFDGGRVISSAINAGKNEGPKYYPLTKKLMFYDNVISYPIKSSMPELVISVDQTCGINYESNTPAISFEEKGEVTSGTLKFELNENASTDVENKFTISCEGGAISGFSSVTFEEPLILKTPATAPTTWDASTTQLLASDYIQKYNLYIGDTQVNENNADDVFGDGTVKFSVGGNVAAIYTLTLNDAELTEPIKIGLSNLIIDVKGTNTITTNETCIQKMENTNPSLTFKSTSDIVGSLNLKNDNGGIFSDDLYGKITINEEFAMILQYYDKIYSNTYYLTNGMTYEVKLAPSYGVTVGGMQIYEGNAADVIGEGIGDGEHGGIVSFDKATSTLTLNNANLSGIIKSSLPNLIIDLIGNNSISSGGDRALQAGNAVNMTIQSSATIKGSLNMHKNYSSTEKGNFVDGNVNLTISAPLSVISGSLTSDEAKNDYYAVIGMDYGISVTKAAVSYPITSTNRLNVLDDQEDPSVQFDGKNTLILNNANITGVILGDNHSLNATDGLKIYLKGTSNNITNATNAVINNGIQIPLKFATSTATDNSGKLIYAFNGTSMTSVADAFSGFESVVYDNNLATTLITYATNQEVLISTMMQPIVTPSDPEAVNNGTNDDPQVAGVGLGADIENMVTSQLAAGVVKNNILYVLPDIYDGYYQEGSDKLVFLNSIMTDDAVKAIAADVENSMLFPNTPEFAARFNGMCFLVPAGNGTIVIETNTIESGKLHLCLGSNKVYNIPITQTMCEYPILYTFTKDTYVYLYNASSEQGTEVLSRGFDDSRRAPGKKLTTTTQIRRAGAKATSVSSTPPPPLSPKKLTKADVKAALDALDYIELGLTINNTEFVGIEDDAFDDLSGTQVAYVDLSKTSIIDQTVDRREAPFDVVPDGLFIYLPVGNDISDDAGAKVDNVVIGTSCPEMLLSENSPFKAAMDFTAEKAKLDREFIIGQSSSIYLPFAINEETANELGTFYKLADVADGKVTMESVEKTEANIPYMFKANKEALSFEMVGVASVLSELPFINGVVFEGTYQQMEICSTADLQYYCFMATGAMAGQFVHVETNPVTVKPFRAYMVKSGSDGLSNILDIDWGDGTTGLNDVRSKMSEVRGDVFFDLQGRQVTNPTKGIYIHNGKKVVIK